MALSSETSQSNPQSSAQAAQKLDIAQAALAQSRRRLLGAAVLLLIACSLIPWVLDSTPRTWGDDVILRMPKSEQPYQTKPNQVLPSANVANPVQSTKPNPQAKP